MYYLRTASIPERPVVRSRTGDVLVWDSIAGKRVYERIIAADSRVFSSYFERESRQLIEFAGAHGLSDEFRRIRCQHSYIYGSRTSIDVAEHLWMESPVIERAISSH